MKTAFQLSRSILKGYFVLKINLKNAHTISHMFFVT